MTRHPPGTSNSTCPNLNSPPCNSDLPRKSSPWTVALLPNHSICHTRNAEAWPLSSSSAHMSPRVGLKTCPTPLLDLHGYCLEFRSAPESLAFLQPIFHRWLTDPETCSTHGPPSASVPANSRSLRSSETVPSKPSQWPRPWFKHRHPPRGTAPHWLQRCSLTVPGCPSVRPRTVSLECTLIMSHLCSRGFSKAACCLWKKSPFSARHSRTYLS